MPAFPIVKLYFPLCNSYLTGEILWVGIRKQAKDSLFLLLPSNFRIHGWIIIAWNNYFCSIYQVVIFYFHYFFCIYLLEFYYKEELSFCPRLFNFLYQCSFIDIYLMLWFIIHYLNYIFYSHRALKITFYGWFWIWLCVAEKTQSEYYHFWHLLKFPLKQSMSLIFHKYFLYAWHNKHSFLVLIFSLWAIKHIELHYI